MSATTPKPIRIRKPGNPATKFPMMCAAAEAFGIHRNTLYRVLKGQHPDRAGYAEAYRAFVAAHSSKAA